jgi:hypothetical protein
MSYRSSFAIEISSAFLVFLEPRLIWISDPSYASDLTALSLTGGNKQWPEPFLANARFQNRLSQTGLWSAILHKENYPRCHLECLVLFTFLSLYHVRLGF